MSDRVLPTEVFEAWHKPDAAISPVAVAAAQRHNPWHSAVMAELGDID